MNTCIVKKYKYSKDEAKRYVTILQSKVRIVHSLLVYMITIVIHVFEICTEKNNNIDCLCLTK